MTPRSVSGQASGSESRILVGRAGSVEGSVAPLLDGPHFGSDAGKKRRGIAAFAIVLKLRKRET